MSLVVALLAGCSTVPSLGGSPGLPQQVLPELPDNPYLEGWGCDPYWLEWASVDGFFAVTERIDLVASTSLPGVKGADPVPFVSPAVCVFETQAEGLSASRKYVFADGMFQDLAANFEHSGWDGYLAWSDGIPEGSYQPPGDGHLMGAHIRWSINADGSGELLRDFYVLSLTYELTEELSRR